VLAQRTSLKEPDRASKTLRVVHALSGGLLAVDVAYLQLARMPALRSCVIEHVGVKPDARSLVGTTLGCLPGGDRVALLVAVVAALVFFGLGLSGGFAAIFRALERRGLAVLAPLSVVALAALSYLAPGDALLADAFQFQALSAHLMDVLLSGKSTYWSFYWYMGCAPYAYYGWLLWLVSGGLGLVVGLNLANKLLFFAFHLGSAAAAFGFTRTLTKDTRAAAVSALAYGLCFDHFGRVFSGRTHLSLLYLLLPLLFWVWELRLAGRLAPRIAVACVAVLSCLSLLTHQVDGAFMLIGFTVYALVRGVDRGQLRDAIGGLAAAFALGALLSSFWTIPLAAEIVEVSASSKAANVLHLAAPGAKFLWALVPALFRDRPIHYLGFGIVVLALLGLRADLRQKRRALTVFFVLTALASVLESTRHVPALLLGIATAAGLGFRALEPILAPRVAALVLLLCFADSFAMTGQLGYPSFDYLRRFYGTVHAGDGERVVDLPTDRHVVWPSFVYLFGKHETVFGPLIEIAPSGLSTWMAIAEHAAQEHYDRRVPFGRRTLDGLYVLGVRRLILHEEQVGRDPDDVFDQKRAGFGLERDLATLSLPEHSVVIAAPRRTHVALPELHRQEGWGLKASFEQREIPFDETGKLLDVMALDRKSASAAAILVVDADDASLPGPATLHVRRIETDPNLVTIDYESNPSFLELAYAYSGHLSVRIDGVDVPFQRTAFDTIAIRTPGGAHRLEIEGRPSALRRLMLLPSVLGVLLTLGLVTVGRRR